MPAIVVREGGLIVFPDSVDKHHVIEQLLRYSAASPFPCFRLKHGAIHAAEIVGTIQLGRLRLSILPKSDLDEVERDKEFLLNLLRAAGYLGPRSAHYSASVRATSLDPLEAMLTEFGREVLSTLKDGVPRRYEEFRADSETLRGRLDFGQLSRKLPGADVKLPIRYTALSPSNTLTRTVHWVAQTLMLMARGSEPRRLLAEVLSLMEFGSGPRPTRSEILGLSLSRYEKSWSRTVEIAKLLVDGKFIDPTFAGRTDAFGMLFPLQHLFERAMRRILTEAGISSGLSVTHRTESLHMLQDAAGEYLLRLKPDFVFTKAGKSNFVGDAKWKRLNKNERAYGVSRTDVYQMNAYLSRYQVANAALFFPRMNWMEAGWHETFCIPPENRKLHLVSVDIEKLVSHVSAIKLKASETLSGAISSAIGLNAQSTPTI